MYEARYWGILSAYTILHVQAGFIHVKDVQQGSYKYLGSYMSFA